MNAIPSPDLPAGRQVERRDVDPVRSRARARRAPEGAGGGLLLTGLTIPAQAGNILGRTPQS